MMRCGYVIVDRIAGRVSFTSNFQTTHSLTHLTVFSFVSFFRKVAGTPTEEGLKLELVDHGTSGETSESGRVTE